jgi:formate-dependent nitrite reductase membrane component NrfD
MQACPYDALYIDPATHTAAKCNFCAHRIDRGYAPACVIVCPAEAIIAGDLDDPNSAIARLVAREAVVVRKPEKNTQPNLFYINGDAALLSPEATARQETYLWSEQAAGVGHHVARTPDDQSDLLLTMALERHAQSGSTFDQRAVDRVRKEIRESDNGRRVYDVPSKGVLWGWEVPAYLWTKAVAAGTFLLFYLWQLVTGIQAPTLELKTLSVSLGFLALTGGFLILDLDRRDRFLYVLLRPNWSSWLVRGAYLITFFGAIAAILLLNRWFDWSLEWLALPGMILAVLVAIYTAFLFAQAKGRDFWQSPLAPIHLLVHALLAGSAVLMVLDPVTIGFMKPVLKSNLLTYTLLLLVETALPHGTVDGQKTAALLRQGYYARWFAVGFVVGVVIPAILLFAAKGNPATLTAGFLVLAGCYVIEFVRIRVPQLIPLS